jgi:hypothetical protein
MPNGIATSPPTRRAGDGMNDGEQDIVLVPWIGWLIRVFACWT